jgi:hypothetical protein
LEPFSHANQRAAMATFAVHTHLQP